MTASDTSIDKFDKWFVGFFDGEGCVGVAICPRQKNKTGFEIMPLAQISHAQMAGSIDADGCISVHINPEPHNTTNHQISPYVQLQQLHSDQLINALAAYAERRDITYHTREKSTKETKRDQYQWTVRGRQNTENLLSPVRDLFIVKQAQVDILLDDIIPRMERGVHHEKEGYLEVMQHVDRLTAYNSQPTESTPAVILKPSGR